MTEEEMARESYLKEDSEYLSMLDEGELYNAGYFAGLHEGQPKWHDLRKDPNDLPVFETELLCQKYSGRCFVGYYHYNDNKFYPYEKGNSYDVTDVMRWADIGIL